METVRELDLIRAIPAPRNPVLFRAAAPDAGNLGRLVVRFSPFNAWYEVDSWWEGNFLERTVRGAFARTIKNSLMADGNYSVRALFDHGYDPSIGNKVLSATEDLREDPDSAVLEGDLFDTSYNRDLEPGLRANVYGSSFRFRVIEETWNDEPGTSDHNPKGLPERTMTQIRLFEAGPVTFPASPTATAEARGQAMTSLTDAYYERAAARDARTLDLLQRSRALRVPTATAGQAGAPGEGPALYLPADPARRHSDGPGHATRRALVFPELE
jgi:HK97 family phage prohead protease